MTGRHEKKQISITERRTFIESVYDSLETIIGAMILLVLVFTLLFRMAGVNGDSMQPTLNNNDRLLLSTVGYSPRYGDIVVINRYTEGALVKRVIGKAGDTIRIDNTTGQIYRNENLLIEKYIAGRTLSKDLETEVTVPHNCVFVLGDNRENSKDSRYNEIGMVQVDDIIGRAFVRVWPINRFSFF